jgi:hypothetical protein
LFATANPSRRTAGGFLATSFPGHIGFEVSKSKVDK